MLGVKAKQHIGPVGRLAMVRALFQRFMFLALLVAAIAFMIIQKINPDIASHARVVAIDGLAPIVRFLGEPAGFISNSVQSVREFFDLQAENQRLREENAFLLRQHTINRHLERENQQLSAQLNLVPAPDVAFVTARVVADTGGAFVQSLLVDAGEKQGVRRGQAVMLNDVLVGRVFEVGNRSARILLLTDLNSRVSVEVEGRGGQNIRAVMVGDNTEMPNLGYITGNPNLQTGDRVVTASRSQAFPPGVPVGHVIVDKEGMVKVSPLFRRHEIDFVTMIDYGLPGALAEGASIADKAEGEQ